MKTLRAAIIGCGGIHHVHAKTLADIPGVELIAVCDTKPERAEASAKAYGARAYTCLLYTSQMLPSCKRFHHCIILGGKCNKAPLFFP